MWGMFRDGICGMFVGRVIGEQRDRQECVCKGPGITSRSLHIILRKRLWGPIKISRNKLKG